MRLLLPRQASPSPGFASLDRRRSIEIEDLGLAPCPFPPPVGFRDGIEVLTVG